MNRLGKIAAFARAHWPVLLPAFVYLYVFPYLPELRSPNELCRLHQTRALVDHHAIEINQVLADYGWVGDLSCVAIARDAQGNVEERQPCPAVRGQPRFREEHYYPSKAPLLSIAAAPVYWVLEAARGGPKQVPEVPLVFFARLLCTVLPAVLLLVPLRRMLRAELSPAIADALTATYALGSLAFSYAELFMSHQTTGVLLFLAYFAAWRCRRGEWSLRGYALAGLFGGLAVAAEYTAALGLVPLGVYAVATAPGGNAGRLKAVALGVAGLLPSALGLMAYHHAAFGGPFTSGYKFLNDAAYQGWHLGGFLGIRYPDPRAFVLSYFSPLRGLFALAPFLLLALPAWFVARPVAREALAPATDPSAPSGPPSGSGRTGMADLWLSAAELALYSYFTSAFTYDSWGWTTGPRHLTPLVVFLLLPVGVTLEWLGKRAAVGIGAGLMALSIAATSAMTFLNYIPDSLTNALYQVALPFLVTDHLPNTWLSLAGVPNPWAGLPAVLAVLATMGLVVHALLGDKPLSSYAVAGVTLAIVVGLHASYLPRDDAGKKRDADTFRFLEERYVPRPGEASPPFWGR